MENPRIKEINEFLKQLDKMDSSLVKKKQSVGSVLNKGERAFQEELEKVEEYY